MLTLNIIQGNHLPRTRKVKFIFTICKHSSERYNGIAVVYSGRTHEEIAYCQRCLEMANVYSKLGNRIYLPDEFGNVTVPQDADKWRQCHKCGTIYPIYEAKLEADIVTLTQPCWS
jgi:hypothetical protein